MFKNYLKVAYRNILRQRGISFISILGLAIGMTACLFITYFVRYEKSFDEFHLNKDRIYRLRYERTDQEGEAVRFASCCPPAGLQIRKNYDEVEKVARIFRYRATVSHFENRFIEDRMYFAEPDFFHIFKYKFIAGEPESGISEPNTAFISQTTARKYFGDLDPMGQIITIDKKVDYLVKGVFEDIPSNSHLKFDIMLSYQNLLKKFGDDIEYSWGDSGWFTYILFKPNANITTFAQKLPAMVNAEFGEVLEKYKLTCELPLQPLTDIHLQSHYAQEYETNGDSDTVRFLSLIAIFVVIIAWVNYVNLSTARSLTRAKEVGLRKATGASRSQLMIQLFTETVIINIVATAITLFLILILQSFFRQLTGISFDYSLWTQSWFWNTVLVMLIFGPIISGLYPVIVLSSFDPVAVLNGEFGNSQNGINLRKTLVGFQFVIALGMLISTYAVFSQLSFMKSQELGFNIEKKIVIRAPRVRDTSFASKIRTFKELVFKNSIAENFCVTTDVPGRQGWWDAGAIHRKGTDDNKNYQIVGIDDQFTNLFGLKFASGRNFSVDFPSDSSALILNETAAKWLGFQNADEAISGEVIYWGKTFKVVGVLKDYHQQSVKQQVEPHIFRYMPTGRDSRGLFVMKLSSSNINSSIQEIKKQYDLLFPDNSFEYFFLDKYYNEQYRGDELFGKVFGIFSFLAIFVTSLGILGLSSFIVMQRKKEIGVRKVLGASIGRVLVLLSKDFQQLILFSFVIICPVAYLAIRYWLGTFARQMDITIWLFLLPLFIVLLITSATLCLHVVKAAAANPVDSIKHK